MVLYIKRHISEPGRVICIDESPKKFSFLEAGVGLDPTLYQLF